MTVSSTIRRAGPYPGNGVATSFPFDFKVYAKADIAVVFASSLGVESTLVLDSDYSVTLNADQDTTPGGSITYPISGSPMSSTQALAIVGGLDYAQTTALPNGGAYNASIVERALDRITILTQQLRETVNRGVQLAFTTAADVSSRLPAPRAFSVLGWASDGLSLTNFDAAGLGVSVSYAAWQTQTFNGTGAQVAFVLTNDAGVASNCDVAVGGVIQTPGINFSYDPTTKTITFLTGAPPAGTNNVVVRYGQALPQGTVGSTSITDSTATGRSVLTAASATAARSAITAAASGAVTTSGLTQATSRLLGRTTASTGAVEEITAGSTLSFSAGNLDVARPFTAGTAVATTSGTSIDFTSIPSWAKRITIILNEVSTNGTSIVQIQIGAGSVDTTGYLSSVAQVNGSGTGASAATSGFCVDIPTGTATRARSGTVVLSLVSANTWIQSGVVRFDQSIAGICMVAGSKELGGALDRIRLTGADTFDAGSVNIHYE